MKLRYNDDVGVGELFDLLGRMTEYEGDRFPAANVFHVALRDKVKESIALENSISVTVRDDNSKLVGYLRVITDSAYIYYILDVMIDPKYRANGYGHKLVELAVDAAKENGFIKIFLTAIPGAESFYEKFGFKEGMSPVLTLRGEDYV